eukprot:TRINITY_DN116856_c0_g1_i1.p1 TRINITY_DN116856_c0_g1~~TRINITY_DN116856_c0_g1_i1.p1  ORF type:complete len:179 (-),score=40.08 TRINITY_DN116856_c0_g1_i1:178-660(-)
MDELTERLLGMKLNEHKECKEEEQERTIAQDFVNTAFSAMPLEDQMAAFTQADRRLVEENVQVTLTKSLLARLLRKHRVWQCSQCSNVYENKRGLRKHLEQNREHIVGRDALRQQCLELFERRRERAGDDVADTDWTDAEKLTLSVIIHRFVMRRHLFGR